MGISSSDDDNNGVSKSISAVQQQQEQLKKQQIAQAQQLQQNRIETLKGAQEGLNLGLTPPQQPTILPTAPKKKPFQPFFNKRFLQFLGQ